MYLATLMDFINGRNPDANELINNKKLVYEWSRLTGKLHKAAKAYPVWKNSREDDERFGFEAEIDSFIEMSPNDYIRDKWLDMKKRLRQLPIDRDSYGFIHNDNQKTDAAWEISFAASVFLYHTIICMLQALHQGARGSG